MTYLERLRALLARLRGRPAAPPPDPLDLSGIVWSDYRGARYHGGDNGWVKGWILGDVTAVVCRHSIPSPGVKVHAYTPDGRRHERVIELVNRLDLDEHLKEPDYSNHGDVAIVRVDRPWPAECRRYPIADEVPPSWSILRPNREPLKRRRNAWRSFRFGPGYLVGMGNPSLPDDGGSGLPWLTDRNEVISHTHRVWWGEGPNYTHPPIRQILENHR